MAVARSAVAWIGCFALLSSLCVGAERQQLPQASIASRIQDEQASFDIPAQPLVTALRAYSEATGIAVLVDDGLTADRSSAGIQGRYTPAEALHQLLAGTGLSARYASNDAFTLALSDTAAPVSDHATSPVADEERASAVADTYANVLQVRIEQALCRSARTRPGRFRLAMQLWIRPTGAVERTRLLDTAGAADLDSEIVEAMNALRFDPPPAAMPQPVTILLLPRSPDEPFDCGHVRPGEPA
jgi:TonB family protein